MLLNCSLRWLINWLFSILRSARELSIIWERHHCRQWTTNVTYIFRSWPLSRERILPCSHIWYLLWHRALVLPVVFVGPPHLLTSYDSKGMLKTYPTRIFMVHWQYSVKIFFYHLPVYHRHSFMISVEYHYSKIKLSRNHAENEMLQ
jgi:hypothetical protein